MDDAWMCIGGKVLANWSSIVGSVVHGAWNVSQLCAHLCARGPRELRARHVPGPCTAADCSRLLVFVTSGYLACLVCAVVQPTCVPWIHHVGKRQGFHRSAVGRVKRASDERARDLFFNGVPSFVSIFPNTDARSKHGWARLLLVYLCLPIILLFMVLHCLAWFTLGRLGLVWRTLHGL